MNAIEIIAEDLFEKVRSRYSNLQMGDENGTVTVNPKDARFFDFDFTFEGTSLGRVSISINDTGNLKIFYGQGITENDNSLVQNIWYDFLREMRFFAKRRLLRFDTRDISKSNLDKTDFQYLAQNGNKDSNMSESAMYGSSRTSHRTIENTDLIIKHSEAIDPTKPGARSRKIKDLFIQNKEGERFKFPFNYLPGARAMQRHVANGGYPHDESGKKIIENCEEIMKLSNFGRKVKSTTLNDDAHAITEKAGMKLKKLRQHMESMSKQRYYESWLETISSQQNSLVEMDEVAMESMKAAFTVNKFDESLAEIFPLLHAIMHEESELDLGEYVGESSIGEGEVRSYSANELDIIKDLGNGYVLVNSDHEDGDGFVKQGWEIYKSNPEQKGMFNPVGYLNVSPYPANRKPGDIEKEISRVISTDAAKTKPRGIEELAFESWVDALISESLTDDQIAKLAPLVQSPMPVGANGEAVQTLAGIGISDPALTNALRAVSALPNGANTDARDILKSFLGPDSSKLKWGDGETNAPELPAVPSAQPEPSQIEDESQEGTEKTSGNLRDVAKIVMGFYDRENGTWTRGEHGVVTNVKRQFSNDDGQGGEKEAILAAKLIQHLNQKHDSHQEFAEMRRLAGIQLNGNSKK